MKIELTTEQAEAYSRGEAVEVKNPVERWKRKGKGISDLHKSINWVHLNLQAYVLEFGGDWVADWGDIQQVKAFILINPTDSRYRIDYQWSSASFAEVYMSEECAKGLVEKLKTGEVVL